MSSMDAEEMDEVMAQVRLRTALEEHIEASETPPAGLGGEAWEAFQKRTS
jgi:hypothetical protein